MGKEKLEWNRVAGVVYDDHVYIRVKNQALYHHQPSRRFRFASPALQHTMRRVRMLGVLIRLVTIDPTVLDSCTQDRLTDERRTFTHASHYHSIIPRFCKNILQQSNTTFVFRYRSTTRCQPASSIPTLFLVLFLSFLPRMSGHSKCRPPQT